MKKTIFLIILAILGMGIVGYFKAIPGASNQNENSPKIEISPASFDFGQVGFGQILNYTFLVKNTGKEILEIKRIGTSCGCTTAKIAKEKIEPGEEVALLVTYDTKAMGEGPHGRGNQERIIYVKSNDPANAQAEVIINAYVK